MSMKIIDLFSGAGGLTEGFRNPNFDIICHVEKDLSASKTLQLRDAYHYLKDTGNLKLYTDFLYGKFNSDKLFEIIPKDILNKTINTEINDHTINDIFKTIDHKLSKIDKISGVIGGPPCQAYSTIGRATNRKIKSSDVRIYLYRYYIDFLKKYSPDFFVFENVKGLLSFKDIDNSYLFTKKNGKLIGKMYDEFKAIGYTLDYRVMNTKDYGVPQSRERIIIFGTKNNNTDLINDFFDKLEQTKEAIVSVHTALEDLPALHAGEEINSYKKKANNYIEKHYRINNRLPLTQNIARPHNKRDLNIYKLVVSSKENGHNLKYNELPDRLKTHKSDDKFLDRFKALSWDQPSHTVVAHIAKDGHHYIHPDNKQNRSITVREAARLQGFPDDFYFESSRTSAFTQIGNAVPPIFSEKIAQVITELDI